MTTYDSIPYPSHCYQQSSPASLSAIANLFGLSPVKPEKARVLEIGCASGGNIIPLASRFSNARFLGVDLSEKQIEVGQQRVDALNLKNIELVAESILDLDLKDEAFDYIIAHGIYSWVPEDVQNRLLQICGDHLSDTGVAYISYNTLPGWNALKTVRDMMLYHSGNFDDPAQKVLEARKMLNFIAQNIKSDGGAYKELLESEIKTLQQVDDNYLLHDHLEVVNHPCYFNEFMTSASRHGLVYLGDSDLASMYLGNHEKGAVETLGALNDVIRQEQYLDYITNRRFRMTVLCKNGNVFHRTLTDDSLAGLYIVPSYVLAENVSVASNTDITALKLKSVKKPENNADLTGNITCLCYLEILKAAPLLLTFEEIVERVATILKETDKAVIRKEFASVAFKMLFKNMIGLSSSGAGCVTHVSEKPEVFPAARQQGLSESLVANTRHEAVRLRNDQRVVMQYVNGSNSLNDIVECVKGHIEKGELSLKANDKAVDLSNPQAAGLMKSYVERLLVEFARNAMLTA